MSWTPPQCIADDGLVNPDLFDIRAADIDTSTIQGSATALRSMATTVHDETASMSSTWSGLPEGYEAPEQERVYALMSPAEQAADDFKTTLDAMARHLETYASALEGIKPRLAAFEARAATFRAEVINGVTVSVLEGKGPGLGDYAMAGLRWASRLDQDTTVVPWVEDGATVARNDAFMEEFQAFRVEVSTAAAQCANDVNALREFTPLAPLSPGAPAQVMPVGPGIDPTVSMPWGQARSEERNCHETVGHTTSSWGSDVLADGAMLVLGRNRETGGYFEGEVYSQSWTGMGSLLFATSLSMNVSNREAAARAASGESDDPADAFMNEQLNLAKSGWGSIIGYDGSRPDDVWHRWTDDGLATGVETLLNVGTFFIPAGAAVKVTGTGGKAARVVAGAADFAVPGGSWVVRTGVNAVTTGPRVLHLGSGVTVPRTAGLIAAVDGSVRVDVPIPGESVVRPGSETWLADRAQPGRPFDPETSRRETVNQNQAPVRPTGDDPRAAYERAPVDEAGRPVDHRTGEPLRPDGPNGERRWHLKWDPDGNAWVAENPGPGKTAPGDLPARGEPNSYGYDANGDRLPYANHRPEYGPDQVREVWKAAQDKDGRVFVRNLEGKRVEVHWDPGEPATLTSPGRPAASRAGLWDMGHIAEKKYSDLRDRYLSGEISKKEFIAEYQDPKNYKVEDPGVNRSHANESQ